MTTFKKYLLLSLIIAFLNAALLLAFFVPRFDHTDTGQYVSTIEYIAGNPESELIPYRLLKPLPIFIGALLTSIFGAKNALVAQNLVFYLLSTWLIFLIIYHLYQDEKQAFYSTLLYIGAYPMLAYGLAPLTDMPGWFFYIFSVLISLNFLKEPSFKKASFIGLVAGFGMLFKENVAATPIFFAALLFLSSQLSLREKIKHICVFGVAFLFFPLINSIFMQKLYSYSYLDWYKYAWAHSKSTFYMVSFPRVLIEMGRVLGLGWIFVLVGTLKEFAIKNIERAKILLAFIPPSLSFFLWSFPHNRMAYIAAPFLVLLGSFGLLRKGKNAKMNIVVELTLLSIYILANYVTLEFLLRYGIFLQDKF